MNKPALILTAAAGLLIFSAARTSRASIEAGDGGDVGGVSFSADGIADTAETLYNQLTETSADVTPDTAQTNINAFLVMLQQAEGTSRASDPYRVCYGYKHTIQNFSGHPANTGEWAGEVLSDRMCSLAGFGPGCRSTAAGAYQIIKGTWNNLASKLSLPDFGPDSQDAAAIELIRRRGALEDVKAGRVASAINKCRNEWASLPGNYAAQGQRQQSDLIGWYTNNGGNVA